MGTRNIIISDHSDEEDLLPDYEDDEDIVMQSANDHNAPNQSEDIVMHNVQDEVIFSHTPSLEEKLFGPPELGIDDDDLYAPVRIKVGILAHSND